MDRVADAALARRAARHAALGDPSRLSIVDALAHGDVSPGDLQRRLGLSSNLLAHHLRVLEQHDLVVRRRSEADRRRAYVHLLRDHLPAVPSPPPGVPGVPGVPGAPAVNGTEEVVFVCTANSARSQLAAAMWNACREVDTPETIDEHPRRRLPRGGSAGTAPADRVADGAVAAAARRGLRLAAAPRRLEQVDASTLLVTVCDSAHEELVTAGRRGESAVHWSVPDPVRVASAAAFEAAADEIDRRVHALRDAFLAPASPAGPAGPEIPDIEPTCPPMEDDA